MDIKSLHTPVKMPGCDLSWFDFFISQEPGILNKVRKHFISTEYNNNLLK